MFEQFGQSIYKGFTYCVEEIEEDMMYNATTQGTQMWRGVKMEQSQVCGEGDRRQEKNLILRADYSLTWVFSAGMLWRLWIM